MARLKNIKSGAIVSVADEKVSRMGSEWVDAETPEKRGPGRPRKSEVEPADADSTDS
jgi:hypothetical protein